MREINSIILGLVPQDWRRVVGLCIRLHLIDRWQVAKISMLASLTVITDVFGLFMILPVLQFISSGRDIAVLADRSKFWSVVAEVSAKLQIPINLMSLCVMVFVLITIRQIASYSFQVYLSRTQERVGRGLRVRVFSAIFDSRGSNIDTLGSGGLVQSIIYAANYGGMAIASLTKLGVVVLSFAVYGAGLMAVAPGITMMIAGFAVVLSYLTRHFRTSAENLNRTLIDRNQRLIQFLTERYRAWRLIKLSDTAELENRKFGEAATEIGAIIVAIARTTAAVQLLVTPAGAFFMLFGLYASVEYFGVTVAELTLFVLVYLRITPLLNTVLAGRQHLATVFVNLSQAETRLRDAKLARESDPGRVEFHGVSKCIEFRDVSFRYNSNDGPILRGVNLTVPGRATTALTGPSGGGKSTLVDMLPRIIDLESGTITIDGVEVKDFTLASLRRGIAFVPQTPILFEATITENIRYGNLEVTQTEFEHACRMAFVDEFTNNLPERYNTIVGEGGYTLSGGQRQRIALARAFLRRCSLLVLDEPTSALDYQSEQRIKSAIEQYREQYDATVLVIAHRLSTVRSADHIIVLEKGSVAEQGTPQALSKAGRWFYEATRLENDRRSTVE